MAIDVGGHATSFGIIGAVAYATHGEGHARPLALLDAPLARVAVGPEEPHAACAADAALAVGLGHAHPTAFTPLGMAQSRLKQRHTLRRDVR